MQGCTNQRRFVWIGHKPWAWADTPGTVDRLHTRASSSTATNNNVAIQTSICLSTDADHKQQMILTLSLHASPVNLVPTQANHAYKKRFTVSSACILAWRSSAPLRCNLYSSNQGVRFCALPPSSIGKSVCLVAHPTDGIGKAVVAGRCVAVEKAVLFKSNVWLQTWKILCSDLFVFLRKIAKSRLCLQNLAKTVCFLKNKSRKLRQY
jgi:hypothetical protein